MTALAEQYRVPDLILQPEAVRLVLLLESPYLDEVGHRHPLAGSAGRAVSGFFVRHVAGFQLWSPGIPFGCQLLRRPEGRIGIMNSSNFPLDGSVYCPVERNRQQEKIDAFQVIRTGPASAKRRNDRHEQIEKQLLGSLRKRLNALPAHALLIPCGAVARAFLAKCGADHVNIYRPPVPHPSRNQWQNPENFADFNGFVTILNRQLGGDHLDSSSIFS